uniref:MOSC domain-containing protein n=1 Tax=Altererythrobacter segetis TaxID=1104773 RepID=UPI0014074E9C|nr:MOSC domain-containing protein [Altererythrobacter segetis]
MDGQVIAVARDDRHRFAKQIRASICLIAGLGVEGDAHAGETVQHRSRLERTPGAANLRQVHLIHVELLGELAAKGFEVSPGELGENITTAGLDLLSLPRGARLRLGAEAILEVTGLRNPCRQIDDNLGDGARAATLERGPKGALVRKAGVMAIVLQSGEVKPGDMITVDWPATEQPLEPV